MKAVRVLPRVEQLEDRLTPAPQLDLPDGTSVVVLSPARVLVLPPLLPRQPITAPPRPPAAARPPAAPPFLPPPARPVKRLPFIHNFIDLYFPERSDDDTPQECPEFSPMRKRYIGWRVLLSDRACSKDRVLADCSSEKVARLAACVLNRWLAAAPSASTPPPLAWCEWWSTSSQLEAEAFQESFMQQTGTVRVCFTEEDDTMKAHLQLVNDDTGEVYFSGDPVDVQDGYCLTFGPACIECETSAEQGYEQANRPEITRAAAPPPAPPQPPGGRPMPAPAPAPRPKPPRR